MVHRHFSYLQFLMVQRVSTSESQWDKFHDTKVINTKEQYIVISSFKTGPPPHFVILGRDKRFSNLFTVIHITKVVELTWWSHGSLPKSI